MKRLRADYPGEHKEDFDALLRMRTEECCEGLGAETSTIEIDEMNSITNVSFGDYATHGYVVNIDIYYSNGKPINRGIMVSMRKPNGSSIRRENNDQEVLDGFFMFGGSLSKWISQAIEEMESIIEKQSI